MKSLWAVHYEDELLTIAILRKGYCNEFSGPRYSKGPKLIYRHKGVAQAYITSLFNKQEDVYEQKSYRESDGEFAQKVLDRVAKNKAFVKKLRVVEYVPKAP